MRILILAAVLAVAGCATYGAPHPSPSPAQIAGMNAGQAERRPILARIFNRAPERVRVRENCTLNVATRITPAVYADVERSVAGERTDVRVRGPHVRTVEERILVREASEGVAAIYEVVERPVVEAPELVEVRVPATRRETRREIVSPARIERRVGEFDGGEPIAVPCEFERADVALLQTALRRAGHDPGPVDGVIGPRTQAALEAFQRANDLAIGRVTIETLSALED